MVGCDVSMRTAVLALVGTLLGGIGCGRSAGSGALGERFEDRFDRSRPGPDWLDTSEGAYSIVRGELRAQGARNHPLWLRWRLPRDVRIEFTARSESAAGDIKVELFGDGRSYATEDSYTATSYVVIFGGWNNRISAIARLNEHGDDRKERHDRRVVPGREYRFKIERRGGKLTLWLDGAETLQMNDADPLAGSGDDHVAFNDGDAELFFDDLVVTPL